MALTLDEARALHAEFPVIDLHADTAKLMDKLGYDLAARHSRVVPRRANLIGHVDLPRLREGGVAGQFFAFWTWPKKLPGQPDHMRSVLDQLDALDQAIEANPHDLAWARTGADVRAAKAAGKVAVLGGIEGGHALGGRVDAIEMFARRGVRYLGPLHLWPNALGGTSRKPDVDVGLTDHGREVVRECERCGVIVDLAHINRRGYYEVLELTKRPVMVTHTGVAGVTPMWRNLDDDQLRAVAQRGGCVGVIFARQFLGGASIDDVVAHVEHLIAVAGEDAPALGSDFDGFVVPPEGLEDIAALPNLTVALSRRGIAPRVLEKILGGNALRVLDEVPAFGSLAA
ncbi:MAG TPA: dipeptidase [Kofleriaceae bacterium]|nr:dipeptidase [Kofleriaceae bacterium]